MGIINWLKRKLSFSRNKENWICTRCNKKEEIANGKYAWYDFQTDFFDIKNWFCKDCKQALKDFQTNKKQILKIVPFTLNREFYSNAYVCKECLIKVPVGAGASLCERCKEWFCDDHKYMHKCNLRVNIPSPKEEPVRPKTGKAQLKESAPKSVACEKCGARLIHTEDYYCKYCLRWFCKKHRLPENHSCRNPQNPYKYAGRVIYGKSGTEYKPK